MSTKSDSQFGYVRSSPRERTTKRQQGIFNVYSIYENLAILLYGNICYISRSILNSVLTPTSDLAKCAIITLDKSF